MWAQVQASAPLGCVRFTLPKRRGVPTRSVQQQLYVQRVRVKDGSGGLLEVSCVVAQETAPPKGAKPIVWRLLTNRIVHSIQEAKQLIDWYRARWEIEMFFDVLKNACRIEALQLAYRERLERALALFMIVAWRIARLMRLGQTCPKMEVELLFEPEEWKAAYVLSKKPVPKRPPPLNTLIRLIAMLGGLIGRRSDGEPGAKTLWIGMQRITDAVMAVYIAKELGII